MLQEEQIAFFWLAAIFDELNKALDNSELFNQFHNQKYVEFALKFHKVSHFKSSSWKKVFEEQIEKNPSLSWSFSFKIMGIKRIFLFFVSLLYILLHQLQSIDYVNLYILPN